MVDELKGKVAMVTGAAQGMGKAVAELFAEEGATLVLVDLQKEKLLEVGEAIKDKGALAVMEICDISDEGAVRMLVDAIVEEHERVDILVNCAGIMFPTRFHEMTVEEWDKVVAVNLRGVFLLMREVYPHMRAQEDGRIVNFSSTAGRTVSTLGGAHYTASKHGVIGITRAVAKEGGPHGIRVNAVCPGLIDTDMVRDSIDEETRTRFAQMFPINRLGSAHEVAQLVLFLASDRSAYITGACVNISGGDLLA